MAGTGAVGSVSVAEANVPETGLAATGGVGSVSVVAEAKQPLQVLKEQVQLDQLLLRLRRM